MKSTFLFFMLIIFARLTSFGQKAREIITVKVGYSSTNTMFKEAFEPSANVFGKTFNTGNTYQAEGPEFGISKDLNQNVFLDLSFSVFSGKDTRLKVNNNENYYTLKGFQIPLRSRSKISFISGMQMLFNHIVV